MELSQNILLTGAGFTANFGGFLAREMWEIIFNNPKLNNIQKIKNLLRDNFDYEAIYSIILNSTNYISEEKNSFKEIIKESYNSLDKVIKNYNFTGTDPYGINIYGVRELLTIFTKCNNQTGIHFTLNQDLFMERQFCRCPLGFSGPQFKDYRDLIYSRRLDPEKSITLPNTQQVKEFQINHISNCGDFFIKLHGSHGWLSANGGDQMVLGSHKSENIQKEPLLKFYFELFEKALFRQNIKILIIGYGFRDEHINTCLIKAIKEYGLKIHIISTESPELFKQRLLYPDPNHQPLEVKGQIIWNGIESYYQKKLKEIYPADKSKTIHQEDISKKFRQ